ncbi:uncharacterized protein LOC106997743 [Macaca mulatta]
MYAGSFPCGLCSRLKAQGLQRSPAQGPVCPVSWARDRAVGAPAFRKLPPWGEQTAGKEASCRAAGDTLERKARQETDTVPVAPEGMHTRGSRRGSRRSASSKRWLWRTTLHRLGQPCSQTRASAVLPDESQSPTCQEATLMPRTSGPQQCSQGCGTRCSRAGGMQEQAGKSSNSSESDTRELCRHEDNATPPPKCFLFWKIQLFVIR